MSSADSLLAGLDQTQIDLLKEECILVDTNDVKVGSASKKDCHLLKNIENGMLHRAFSVFLFNSDNKLLLQQRSLAKITYPGHFTNTCCSHPLNMEGEIDEENAIGVRRAAQRKLKHELGIEPAQVPVDDFTYLTRIHYFAPNCPNDDKFGEHEIDYILFIRCDVDLDVNENEVKSIRYVSQEELQAFISKSESDGTLITPWFQHIVERFLYPWWDNLDKLDTQLDRQTIHRV
ncbi:isopentenyl-diphosphate Delta-isomerase 1-like isoform X2 [Watersipora subatra]